MNKQSQKHIQEGKTQANLGNRQSATIGKINNNNNKKNKKQGLDKGEGGLLLTLRESY